MTALATVTSARSPITVNRRYIAAGVFILFGLVDIFLFGMFAHQGDATFALALPTSSVHVPSIHAPARLVPIILGAISIALGILRATIEEPPWAKRLSIGAVLLFFVIALLCWADTGSWANGIPVNVVSLLQGTLTASIPLILGALAGCMGERAGVINIAIEGQLLLGAFTAAIVASAVGVLWLGLIGGSLAGGLVGLVLALFAIRWLVDQIILGVVLNLLISGLTGYLYDRLLVPDANTYNSANTFSAIKVPGLGDIPILGPIFFDSTLFLYITYAAIIAVQIGLFSTRWGLRVRAVGEHPTAADTVGIKVNGIRYGNLVMGGMLAGIGGAYLTIGSVGTFSKDMSSGLGYIALAAMIFGRWTPLGATAAALLFGFTEALQSFMGSITVPISPFLLGMLPYVATIVAVAGLVGRVRAPAADGKPYVRA
ncbi:MAG TPA: ABC transporter permease [Streptosporangiaceae bacterium]|nr:ABC transporter permease [Streptosporangiaceae bacterium]